MPAYRFQAAHPSGKFERGILDADSPRQARAMIRERGLTPLEVETLESRQGAGSIVIGGRLREPPDAARLCVRVCCSIAAADGLFDAAETQAVADISVALGLPADTFDS